MKWLSILRLVAAWAAWAFVTFSCAFAADIAEGHTRSAASVGMGTSAFVLVYVGMWWAELRRDAAP